MTDGMVIAKDVMLPMRDGVHLATDIYRPAQDGEAEHGQFPTILARTSYDKSAQRYVDSIPNFFTPRGYVVVLQDLRGRYRSPRFDVNPNSGEPVGRHSHSEVATNTVYFDRTRSSHVVLSVIP